VQYVGLVGVEHGRKYGQTLASIATPHDVARLLSALKHDVMRGARFLVIAVDLEVWTTEMDGYWSGFVITCVRPRDP
jgi:hypothetical protein